MLKLYKTYYTENSDLLVYITNINSLTKIECKVNLALFNKYTGRILEYGKDYTLKLNNIKHWKEYNGKVWKEFPYKIK